MHDDNEDLKNNVMAVYDENNNKHNDNNYDNDNSWT